MNPSKMSLADYQDLAKQHQSLATIALRGAERESPQGDSLFLSVGRNVSPRGFESVRDDRDEHFKARKDPEDELVNRKDSQFKSHNQIDDFASSKWKMKKFMPRHEISHDSIQFTVAAEDGTRKRYKKYRNSKMNQSYDFAANASSHSILVEGNTELRDRKHMFQDQQSQSLLD